MKLRVAMWVPAEGWATAHEDLGSVDTRAAILEGSAGAAVPATYDVHASRAGNRPELTSR
jgi:hypothetical protein